MIKRQMNVGVRLLNLQKIYIGTRFAMFCIAGYIP